MATPPECNWDEYYGRKEFDVPEFIVKTLWGHYKYVLMKHLGGLNRDLVVVELGGADSCFYQPFTQELSVAEYHIIDNNQLGLSLFPHTDDPKVFLHEIDLLSAGPDDLGIAADIVFSAGLIEHFTPAETRRIVEFHFGAARPGGLVLMSFPTPTWLYWSFRWLLERAGRFPPLFERPIASGELMPVISRMGTPLENYKIWRTILTQQLMLVRKEPRVA